MIHYFTPYDPQKRIGFAHNEAVKQINDPNAWICLRDADTMFLTPDFGNIIEKAIEAHGNDYQLFGCLTNRLGVSHQLYDGLIANSDMTYHIDIAEQCKGNNSVKECYLVAGMFLLFQKKTWIKAGGFKPSIHFDRDFSNDIIKSGGRLGIIQSVYLFHLYRWGCNVNPQYQYQHLL